MSDGPAGGLDERATQQCPGRRAHAPQIWPVDSNILDFGARPWIFGAEVSARGTRLAQVPRCDAGRRTAPAHVADSLAPPIMLDVVLTRSHGVLMDLRFVPGALGMWTGRSCERTSHCALDIYKGGRPCPQPRPDVVCPIRPGPSVGRRSGTRLFAFFFSRSQPLAAVCVRQSSEVSTLVGCRPGD